jgi:hypothetical protein
MAWRVKAPLSPSNIKVGVAGSVYDSSNRGSLEPLVGVIHELPLPKVPYLNPATP